MLKVGDRFRVKRIDVNKNYEGRSPYIGRVFTVKDIRPNGNSIAEHYSVTDPDCIYIFYADEIELVEEKKVFTKSDLKNGDVIVRRNGKVSIVILDLGVLIARDGWDTLSEINDDLTDIDCFGRDDEWDVVKVYRPTDKWQCQFSDLGYTRGELVYDRERDTEKPLYNGKVVCTSLCGRNYGLYTVGKIYQFKDGQLIADNGKSYPTSSVNNNSIAKIHNFEDWSKWSTANWIEIKE